MALPDNLTGFDVKEALCHPSIGYKVAASKPGHWFLQRGGSLPIQVTKQDGSLRPAYIAMVLFDAGVSEKEFLAARTAVVASESEPPSASSPGP